jgi:3-deoxy-D-manno-octulosonic-acid transferase
LIVQIKKKHPDWIVHFSCLTDTGFRLAKEKLTVVDDIFFVPLDFQLIVRKFFRHIKPDVFVLAESEFWPNLLREADKETKGVLLVNGRISSRSLVQTKRDKGILEKIGVDSRVIQVAGNLKAEIKLPILEPSEMNELRESINIPEGAKVIVAGSVRKGEEEPLLKAFSLAREKNKELLLILAPRHPDRSNEVGKICQKYPLEVQKRTGVHRGTGWDVLILDTLAYYAKPVFFGPHMDNFAHLAEIFVEAGAAQVVKNQSDLVRMFSLWDEAEYQEMGQKAKLTLESLQGATEKTLNAIDSLMNIQKGDERDGDE